MKIGILSQDIRLYSTKRLYETAVERGHDTEVVSYLRINPPKTRFDEVSFGRIVTKQSARKKGLSEAVILKSLEIVEKEGLGSVRISAQSYLEKYYAKFGFVKCSDEYLEDNIPHMEMLRR